MFEGAGAGFCPLLVIFGSSIASSQLRAFRADEAVSRHHPGKSVTSLGSLRPANGPGMRWQGDCVMLGQDWLAR
jgi:hypothetical protein